MAQRLADRPGAMKIFGDGAAARHRSTERGASDFIAAFLQARGLRAQIEMLRTTSGAWLAICSVAVARQAQMPETLREDLLSLQRDLIRSLDRACPRFPVFISWATLDDATAASASQKLPAVDALHAAADRLRATIAAKKAASRSASPAPATDRGQPDDRVALTSPLAPLAWFDRELEQGDFALVDFSQPSNQGEPRR